jgi:AcrR family transcriptional regulator
MAILRSSREPSSTAGAEGRKYHHGDLRAALLRAGEQELAEKGCAGFSLRGTAKRARVSHAAPAYHFGDVRELRTALAARGFERLSAAMRSARTAAAPDAYAQLVAAAIAYFRFGTENPALLDLMFEPNGLDNHEPCRKQSAADVVAIFTESVSALQCVSGVSYSQEERTLVAAVWSVVHGFTSIASSGGLKGSRCDDGRTSDGELAQVLALILPRPGCAGTQLARSARSASSANTIQPNVATLPIQELPHAASLHR